MNRFLLGIFYLLLSSTLYAVKSHEIWWEKNLETEVSLETFHLWLGDINAPSREKMREHIKKMHYTSIVDIPCGLCLDYWGLKYEGTKIHYLGVDITPRLVALATNNNIPIVEASIESLPLDDCSFDMSYARHILEHLDSYESSIRELVRVAKKEVFITFFIKPTEEPTKINLAMINDSPLYHNSYNKMEIERYVFSLDKVSHIEWEELEKEMILHIYLKHEM